MKNQMILRGASLMVLAVLTACGGGGGGGGTTTPPDNVVKTCANGANNYPTCDYVPAKLQLTVPTPPFSVGSEEMNAFNYLNDLRSSLGLGKLAYSLEIEKAAQAHMNYIATNQIFTHIEDATKPGFTGVDQKDRVTKTNYIPNAVDEGLTIGKTVAGSLRKLVDSIFHREAIFDQSYADFGIGKVVTIYNQVPLDQVFSVTINYANNKENVQRNASDFVMVYPSDGQTNVSALMAAESPNPFPADYPDGNYYGKVGYPLSFHVEKNAKWSLKTFTVTEAGTSTPLPSYLMGNKEGNGYIRANSVFLTPKNVLKFNTTYHAFVEATVNGKTVTRNWSFTTSPTKIVW